MFHEFEVVKVINLLDAHRAYDGSEQVMRPPRVGDIGAVVFIHSDENQALSCCTVECVDEEGYTVWLADFLPEELELIA